MATSAYLPPAHGNMTGQGIMGVMSFEGGPDEADIEVIEDGFSIAANSAWKISEFPALKFKIVSEGQTVIPVVQTPPTHSAPLLGSDIAGGENNGRTRQMRTGSGFPSHLP